MGNIASPAEKSVIEHVRELRLRILWCCAIFLLFATGGYFINSQLLHLIQKPLNQTLYYTSPAGGFSFVFKISVLFGLVAALPFICYQIIKFIAPVVSGFNRKHLLMYLFWSVVLAFSGLSFAYFVSLPAALHFLGNFGGPDIQALIKADEYFNFAVAYLAGFALLFQLPLIMLFINRIKPQKPSKLLKLERYVVLGSFIVAAILTPTPDPFNQLVMAVPIIVLYQLAIVAVWLANRKRRSKRVAYKHSSKIQHQVETSHYELYNREKLSGLASPVVTSTVMLRLNPALNVRQNSAGLIDVIVA